MTKRNAGGSRSLRILEILNTIGDVLLFQLCFVVASLGIVTMVPAAVALQRYLDDVLFRDETAGIGSFFARLGSAFRRYWVLSLVVPVLIVVFVVGILFWVSARGPVGLAALAILIPLAGLFAGLYLAGLAEVVTTTEDSIGEGRVVRAEGPTGEELIAAAWTRLRGQPLHVAGCVVVLVTWFLLLLQVPTLVLVGSGTVPALLGFWLRRGARRP